MARPARHPRPADRSGSSPARVLVLGGTSWLGGAAAGEALRRGHEVTCLARGESGACPAGATLVRADRIRAGAYGGVAHRRFDAVIEVSWQPDFVRAAVRALAGQVGHWVYVSSMSVYADDTTAGADESAATHPPWAGTGTADLHDYAGAKVACERAVLAGVGERHTTIVRAGLIGGYGDRSDRLGYWPARLDRARQPGEPVLVPALDGPVQVIDVLDLARWLVVCAEDGILGTFNAAGDQHCFADLLEECVRATGARIDPVEADDAWLLAEEVEPYSGPESLPLWLPAAEYAGHSTRSNAAARAAGLRPRPLADTVRDALAWERELGVHRQRRAGLTPAREAALLSVLAG